MPGTQERRRSAPVELSQGQQRAGWLVGIVVSLLIIVEGLEKWDRYMSPDEVKAQQAEIQVIVGLSAKLGALEETILAATAFNTILETQQNDSLKAVSSDLVKVSQVIAVLKATTEVEIDTLKGYHGH